MKNIFTLLLLTLSMNMISAQTLKDISYNIKDAEQAINSLNAEINKFAREKNRLDRKGLAVSIQRKSNRVARLLQDAVDTAAEYDQSFTGSREEEHLIAVVRRTLWNASEEAKDLTSDAKRAEKTLSSPNQSAGEYYSKMVNHYRDMIDEFGKAIDAYNDLVRS